MDKKRSARTASVILSMMRDAISSGNEKDYWKTLGFVEGMKRAGSYDEAFAKKLEDYITAEWKRRKKTRREIFHRIWELTA